MAMQQFIFTKFSGPIDSATWIGYFTLVQLTIFKFSFIDTATWKGMFALAVSFAIEHPTFVATKANKTKNCILFTIVPDSSGMGFYSDKGGSGFGFFLSGRLNYGCSFD